MMKFDRIHRNANDTVVHVVMFDKFNKRVELWRWDAAVGGDASPPELLMSQDFYDYTERFGLVRKFNVEARRLSQAS
jgi:hypothetical protein